MFAPSLRCESWRGILSLVDSTYSGVDRTKSGVDSTKSGADSIKSGWRAQRAGGQNEEWVDRTMNRKDRERERKAVG